MINAFIVIVGLNHDANEKQPTSLFSNHEAKLARSDSMRVYYRPKRSFGQGNVFYQVSVILLTGGEYLTRYTPCQVHPPWAGTPPWQVHPPRQVHPSCQVHHPLPGTPPPARYTPPWAGTPPRAGTPPFPPGQVHPPLAGTPPGR